ncbi:MAG: molybdopterin-guanine dinucleotide biosynthesis protein B [Lentisphaerae bacterium RIFOXYC12_FULL_60_16]|nr:MAG: molybdopterin-guanine dinucleotide biosynthesis protein B [Lentisphaerae bacterium RIFOXYC12_FULL_60_16]OGV84778.1 MAG: molybdopterin-guanine dinucleotide biosynthesis protein B [Lentisphaerae bacterium RIFOXYB12_FULL_60_10]
MAANNNECSPSHSRPFASIRGWSYPVFGICGFSGSGKTTLIEALVRILHRRGLIVGVVKQDAHGLDIDREGKDTDRIFKAGADVFIRDARQVFTRLHRPPDLGLPDLIARIGSYYDLILVEGHKTTPLPCKIWLCKPEENTCPPEATGIRRILGWTEDRERIALEMLDAWLPETWLATPVYAGILIGGASTRMGRPKHLIATGGGTWLHTIVEAVRGCAEKIVILGGGGIPGDLRSLPVLPDAEDAKGPLRGMRAAMRWAPGAGWMFVACDQPHVSRAAIDWLLTQRRPGVRAVMPVVSGISHPEPLLAYYDFRMAPVLEQVRRPCDLALAVGVAHPLVPAELAQAWRNLNSPVDLAGKATHPGESPGQRFEDPLLE